MRKFLPGVRKTVPTVSTDPAPPAVVPGQDLRSGVSQLRGTAILAGKIVGFFLLILYSHYLTPADFGVLVLLYVTMRLLDSLVIQGLTSAVVRAQALDFKDDARARREAVSTAFFHCTGSALLLFGGLQFLAGPASQLLFGSTERTDLLRLMFLAGGLRAIQNVPRQLLRAQSERQRYDALKLADFVAAATLNVYVLAIAGMGLTGIVYGEVIREAIFALLFGMQLRGRLTPSFSRTKLRQMLGHGLPRVRRAVAIQLLSTGDRYFLQAAGGAATVGLYAFGYRLAELLGDFVIRPLLQAWPTVQDHAERESRDGGREILGRLLTYFVAVAGVAALALCVFAEPFLQLMAPPRFVEAARVVPLLALAGLLSGMHRFLMLGVQTPDKGLWVSRLLHGTALLCLACNAILVPRFGMQGAAAATVLSQVVLCAGAGWLDRRRFGIRVEYGRMVRVVAALGIAFAAWRWVTPEHVLGQLASGWAVLLLYPALLGVLGFYTVAEIEKLRDLFNRRVSLRPAATSAPSAQQGDLSSAGVADQPTHEEPEPVTVETGGPSAWSRQGERQSGPDPRR